MKSNAKRVTACFDTNIFDHLVKRAHGVTEQHVADLRALINSGTLLVVVNLHAIDEAAANPNDPVSHLRLMLELCDWNYIAKPAHLLLTDDVKHFGYNGEPSHPLVEANERVQLLHGTKELVEDPAKLEEFRALVARLNPLNRRFRQAVQERAQETRPQFLAVAQQEAVRSFEQYFDKEARAVIGWLTEHVRLQDQYAGRSLDQFLRIKSIRMAVGMCLSYIWEVNVERRKAKPSDGRDFQHAICAAGAGADVLVTHDKGLASLAGRVAINGFRVMTLKQLIQAHDRSC